MLTSPTGGNIQDADACSAAAWTYRVCIFLRTFFMLDRYGREIDYMRVSVTDRCNLRCRCCMPDDIELAPMQDVLSYEEIKTARMSGIGG